jgi:hypothetical protein
MVRPALAALRLSVATRGNAVHDPGLRQLIEQDLQIILARKPEMRPAVLSAYATASAEGGASYREHRPRSRSLFSDAATKADSLILHSARLPEVLVKALCQ